jgi:pimeloyl-ACP methyl ester carboxylesterase
MRGLLRGALLALLLCSVVEARVEPFPASFRVMDIKTDGATIHVRVGRSGPDEERLVAGRERIYRDRFYNELSADPKGIDAQTRQHYAHLYARPHAMQDVFEQFVAFPQDGIDKRAFLAKGKLTMPVLAIGGEKSDGATLAEELRFVVTDVTPLVIPGAGHWQMEAQSAKTVAAIMAFLKN